MEQIKSVCPYCGVGCGLVMQVENQRIISVEGDKSHPTNRGRLCTKGNSCAEAITATDRLESAWLRTSRQHEPVRTAMDDAIRETARRLRGIIDKHGPDALALYVSGQMSLEAQYLANKLAKGFIGTNNIESNSRLCMASAASGYKLSLGADGPPGSYDDFDHADLFLVTGANMADCHPILFLRMMERVNAGAKLIVVDPRRTATAEKASLFLQIKPGTDLALLNGLLALLVQNGQLDNDFIAQHTEGWQAMPDFLLDYTPQQVAERTGLREADIRQAAQWIGEAGNWMSCWTMGLNQSTHGTWSTNALCNLHLATGAICRPGSGPFSLTGQPNAMGGREMGYMGGGLPGQRTVLAAEDRAFVEHLWQRPPGTLRDEVGGGTVALFEAMSAGEFKACWIICTNPVATVPNRKKVIAGLERAELVIVQDAFLDTETNRYADILLPGALWAEAEGVMVNSERTMTLMQQAVSPPGDALADWQIIARVACEMGYADGFCYASAAEVFDEIRAAYNPATGYDIRGASYARLRQTPLQWPCAPDDDQTRHPIRYLQDSGRVRFATASGRGQFFARPDLAPAEMPDDDYPLVLNTGRVQHQWHTLTKTGKITLLNTLNPGPFIEISPVDAQRLAISEGDWVDIRSRRGMARLPAVVTDRVRPGNSFAPFHWNDRFGDNLAINALTSDALDPVSLQPELKHCAIALVRSEQQPAPAAAPATDVDCGLVLVLWASTTGNAQAFARRCAEQLLHAGLAVKLRAMDNVSMSDIAAAPRVLLLASTFGDGDPPANGAALWAALNAENAPALSGTAFSVLAFGDASYAQFCGFGRNLDARLAALGAQRLLACQTCDAGDIDAAQQWLTAIHTDILRLGAPSQRAAQLTAKPGFSRHAPVIVPLVTNQLLSAPGAEKEIRQFAFDLQGSGLHYEVGDALGVWPRNCPQRVAEILDLLALDGHRVVQVSGVGEMSLQAALCDCFDITRITPEILRLVADHAQSETLDNLLASENSTELTQWLWGRQIIDLLQSFPVHLAAEPWLSALRRLQPRLYSISSSPKVSPQRVELTISTVRYGDSKQRGGVCSTFLADRAERVAIFIQPAPHFRLPADPNTAAIMVGAGTGIAPFRGFLQEREATGARGDNWLFFGEQHAATDFYYREELEAWQRDGVLQRFTCAFSRDQAQKIYVQHRMLEQGEELWRWLAAGAHFYVCGDASQMAKDVENALKQVAQTFGGMSAGEANAWLVAMARENRYQRDVY
ncbi:bifunctional nitrate reductase/sulfite reductase flavoprotein subunit alpha [Kosakonia pseudosacchari]|uniref:bifunctional nitrate reductase/sulfite reductase flavoprotein subunit alpha n=1 Tax=Kosakonia pseudosacchari TaxID=1646340 RepID=UPI0022F0939E|nr:bifunctional nitrate reductase/sulfite reductase flavoprotein subunit alpha [Kosakonia pseudosacchari]WBU50292.1 bifunctional nitrate reductase/sulfite reductase flavoprotein subunit alpha [Kosakonia pseudosacchari]